jgi:hypothetical protein
MPLAIPAAQRNPFNFGEKWGLEGPWRFVRRGDKSIFWCKRFGHLTVRR